MTDEILVTAIALKRQTDEMEGILEIVRRWAKIPTKPSFIGKDANSVQIAIPLFCNKTLLSVVQESLEKQLQTVQKEFKEL